MIFIAVIFVRAPKWKYPRWPVTGQKNRLAWLTMGGCRAVRRGGQQPRDESHSVGGVWGMSGDGLCGSVYMKFKTSRTMFY